MIDRQSLLTDLQALLKRLEADLLERSESTDVPDVGKTLRAEFDRAKKAERTAQNYEDWRSDAITQAAAGWVLSCVFVRFLEDNQLIDPPRISGPTSDPQAAGSGQRSVVSDQQDKRADSRTRNADSFSRLQQARDEHTLFFQDPERARLTDREYLLAIFDELARLPGTKDVFGEHNPIRELPNWLSGDAAGGLLRFFQKIDADTGALIHDFTDPSWDTRFLGDLYQDLSEAARKKYALLQTPEFVEEFILDRTLEPALDEFGLEPESDQRSAVSGQQGKRANSRSLKADRFKMIDPACGSGHFLLGAFPRILRRWQRQEPGGKIRDLVQKTLNSIYGVDLNPYAIAIARFRLLLVAMRASGIRRLADAPAFTFHLACGDSLLHADFRGGQQVLAFELESETSGQRSAVSGQRSEGEETADSRSLKGDSVLDCEHAYQTEDLQLLQQMLRPGQYHVVVANPPYITPKDRQLNERYRRRFESCHMKYSLAVPFMERIFRLAIAAPSPPSGGESRGEGAGYTGQITANSFMKREFGKKLIESFLPKIDLTHVIDTSGAYIPGHGTPTVILFGRNRPPVAATIRAVMGIRGEPSTPDDPAHGLVWSAIINQIDQPGSQSEYVSVDDSERQRFHSHPWSIGGGGAAELKEHLDERANGHLTTIADEIGILGMTNADEAMLAPDAAFRRMNVERFANRRLALGDEVRDWQIIDGDCSLFPYRDGTLISLCELSGLERWLWPCRTVLGNRATFARLTYFQEGRPWWEWHQITLKRLRTPLSIVYAEVATHNHFVLDRGGKVFKQTAPVIKLPADATEDDHLALLGLLNSSTACFWMKQVCFPKGGDHVGQEGARVRRSLWDERYAFNATNLEQLPISHDRPLELARQLDQLAQQLAANSPDVILTQRREGAKAKTEACLGASAPLRETLDAARARSDELRGKMISLQEDLDWECYGLYGLLNADLTQRREDTQQHQKQELPGVSAPLREPFAIRLGERAFEIVLARKIAAGETLTTWFARHGSTPITEIPPEWPAEYRTLVARRIKVIESNREIALIEQPEYKRRWNWEPWESQQERALRNWLLARLESYFDFDGRMQDLTQSREDATEEVRTRLGASAPLREISLYSIAKLADVARQDAEFMAVGEVYRDDAAFDVQRLVEELVQSESVPLLPILRYKPSGLRKRKEWEQTWELQRREDALSAQLSAVSDHLEQTTDDNARERLEAEKEALTAEIQKLTASISVPPKYISGDFISSGGSRYWALRGKLDVPKERWISFPHCEGPDGTLVIAWAGYNHLQLARAISAYFVDIQERLGGRDDPRLVPLLAGIIELLPWLKQWHHDVDSDYNQRMDEVFEGFVTEEAKHLGMTIEQIKAWEPPKKSGRKKQK